MRAKFLTGFLLFIFTSCAKQPLNVLIIGGGPAGLATAIEAKQNGAEVSIVEVRKGYSRKQWLFLSDSSIQLLEKWEVKPSQMKTMGGGSEKPISIVPIKDLEESLEARAKELGVKKIQGEFTSLQQHVATILTNNGQMEFPYDILVGADGPYSRVREALHIKNNCFGEAKARVARIALSDSAREESGISPTVQHDGIFIRRFRAPSVSLVFMQTTMPGQEIDLRKEMEACGWDEEVASMDARKAITSDIIDVRLCQAATFSNEKECAILVGDAAATASFLEGVGANTALKGALHAGNFLKKVQEGNSKAYDSLNEEMKATTDTMIEESRYLFP